MKTLTIIFSVAILLTSPIPTLSATNNVSAGPQIDNKAVDAAKKQVAIQLGAVKLGLVKPGQPVKNLTPDQIQTALNAGGAELTGGKVPVAQLVQATIAALQSPVSEPSLGLDVTQITPAAIIAAAAQINPGIATPSVARVAVVASFATSVDGNGIAHPLFGVQPDTSSLAPGSNQSAIQELNSKTKDAQLQAAVDAQGAVLAAALHSIDPNVKPGVAVKVAVSDPNYAKIQSTISAISSASISGLGNINIGVQDTLLYGKTAPNIQALTSGLVSSSQGLVELANTANGGNPVLTAVASGARQAAPTATAAITSGVIAGAYNSYVATTVATGLTPLSASQFAAENANQISLSLSNAGVTPPPATGSPGNTVNQSTQPTTGSTSVTGGGVGTPGGSSGVPGLGTFGLTPGGNSPVTNTQGR